MPPLAMASGGQCIDRRIDRRIGHAFDRRLRVEIDALRAAGVSFNAIAAALNRRGIPGMQGGRWYGASVRRALARPDLPLNL